MKHTIFRGIIKLLSGITVVTTIVTMWYVMPVSAAISADTYSYEEYAEFMEEQSKQDEIELIFEELNELAVNEAHFRFLEVNGIEQSENKRERSAINKSEEELYLQLAALGVKKINPQEPEDISMLYELTSVSEKSNMLRSQPTDTAPDFAALANAFTVCVYDGSYSYKGENHIYRYIRVIDNKGHGALCQNVRYDAVKKNVSPSVIASVLEYNFGFVFSKFLGTLPYGFFIDWTLGNVFSALKGIDNASSVIANGEETFYNIYCTSVTEMVYYFYYDAPSWNFIGTSATASFAHTNFFAGIIDGAPIHEIDGPVNWSSRAGGIWYNYVESYVDSKSYHSGYYRIDELGTFTIKGFGTKQEFVPKFAALPGDI